MAEELVLDQRVGSRPGVVGEKRAVPAPAPGMDQASEQLLAGPGLAFDEHRGIGDRRPGGEGDRNAHDSAVTDERRLGVRHRRRLADWIEDGHAQFLRGSRRRPGESAKVRRRLG
jgi:hypothetical protein